MCAHLHTARTLALLLLLSLSGGCGRVGYRLLDPVDSGAEDASQPADDAGTDGSGAASDAGPDLCPDNDAKTEPGVCGCESDDLDKDGDGLLDCQDSCPDDPTKSEPGACGCGVSDDDTDGDGTADCLDMCPDDASKSSPGVCGCGVPDGDVDGDGEPDCGVPCPEGSLKSGPGTCGCDVLDTDSDGDATPDCNDGCPADPDKLLPLTCGCGTPDTDSDGDATADCHDQCPADAGKVLQGMCGCGVAETDTDGDASPDCLDPCPNDGTKQDPGACGCGVSELDSDGDGTPDCNDTCPADANKTAPGGCDCGVPDVDADGNGTLDCLQPCPPGSLNDVPGQCGCDTPNTDTDGDGTADCNDACPSDPDKLVGELCGCGVSDLDGDSDGTPDCNELCPADPAKTAPGICGCGTPEGCSDDLCPADTNKTDPGQCGCGTPDTDNDSDGTADCNDVCVYDAAFSSGDPCLCDSDGDVVTDCSDVCPFDPAKSKGNPNGCDVDGDGTSDDADGCPLDPNKTAPGACGCGDADIDGNGLCDSLECADVDGDLIWDGTGSSGGCLPGLIDSDPSSSTRCQDADNDGCDDCSSGNFSMSNDGPDDDGDGICNVGDTSPGDSTTCLDNDHDTCDDCQSGSWDPANDGPDADGDGMCDVLDSMPDGSDLRVHYNFDNPLDPFRESSGSFPGSVGEGSPTYGHDPIRGGVLQLNGGDVVLTAGFQGVLGSAARTVTAWVRTTSDGEIAFWGASNGRFEVFVGDAPQAGNVLCVQRNVAGDRTWSYCGTDVLGDGKWHHLAVVHEDGRSLRDVVLFVDGTLQPHTASAGEVPVDTLVGQDMDIGTGLTGAIDDLRVYDRALSVTEVRALSDVSPCSAHSDCNHGNACRTGSCLSSGICSVVFPGCRPSSCEQLHADQGVTSDGDYTIYLAHDLAKAFSAHCVDMALSARTYLRLVHTEDGGAATHGIGENFGFYKGGFSEVDATIWYSEIRLNTLLPAINTDDRTFSQRLGPAGARFPSYGTAGGCSGTTNPGWSNVDLRGTPFAIAPGETWIPGGWNSSGDTDFPADPKVINITAGGECGWNGPAPYTYGPEQWGSAKLDIVWQPDT